MGAEKRLIGIGIGLRDAVQNRSTRSRAQTGDRIRAILTSLQYSAEITVMKARVTLDELANEVQTMLGEKGLLEAQADGRISSAPDPRTVRYYTTLGLLDRPEIVEREARYARRHVLQLCAIKAMQAAGSPLAEIQTRLYSKTDSELEALIASVSKTRRQQPMQVRALNWREVTIEPGLKILVEQGWTPRMSEAALEDRIRAVLAALKSGDSK
jgi:DNA-binding transcriptional MerR regulator